MVTACTQGGRIHPAGFRGLLAGPRRPHHRRGNWDRAGGRGRRPRGRGLGVRDPGHRRDRPKAGQPEAKRIEKSVTVATIIELVASFAFPVLVIAAGHSDWVLPSIAITIGPLLLWLDHLVHIPRYRPVGWALTVGPIILVATMSGSSLAATTGIAAGVLLLATAAAGFHDLAGLRPGHVAKPTQLSPQAP